MASDQQTKNLRLLDIASRQHGAFSRAQAISCGLTASQISRRLSEGIWRRVLPSVYRIRSYPASWESKAMAALLWAGPNACLSHVSAARALGFSAYIDDPSIVLCVDQKPRIAPDLTVHQRSLPPKQTAMVGCMRVTIPRRTLLDIAGVSSPEVVEDSLDEALRKGMVTLIGLSRMLDSIGSRGRKGAELLRGLIAQRDPSARPTESQLETLTLRTIRNARLPLPAQQRTIKGPAGELRVDFIYEEARVIVEVDGFSHHSNKTDWWKDMERRNLLTRQDWKVYHVTYWALVENGETLVDWLRAALGIQTLDLTAEPLGVRKLQDT